MANQIQGTVYQVDTTMQIESISMAFSTQNIVVRASGMGSCISYYQSPGNIAIEYFVTESYGSLISAANVGEVALIQATIASSGQSFGFPSQNISIQGVNGGIEGANACIQYRGVPYYVTETESELNAKANAGAYRVYTALLTQETIALDPSLGAITLEIGKTYLIKSLFPGDDFTNVGYISDYVPFVATGTTPTAWLKTYVVDITDSQPSVTILQDTITDISIEYGYISAGDSKYQAAIVFNKIAEFLTSKTFLLPINGVPNYMIILNDDQIVIYTDSKTQFINTPIEIRVYN